MEWIDNTVTIIGMMLVAGFAGWVGINILIDFFKDED